MFRQPTWPTPFIKFTVTQHLFSNFHVSVPTVLTLCITQFGFYLVGFRAASLPLPQLFILKSIHVYFPAFIVHPSTIRTHVCINTSKSLIKNLFSPNFSSSHLRKLILSCPCCGYVYTFPPHCKFSAVQITDVCVSIPILCFCWPYFFQKREVQQLFSGNNTARKVAV